MKKPVEIKWLPKPADKDYVAAETYLQLLYGPKKARSWSKKLKAAAMSKYAAKDLLRASATPISEVQAFDWVKQHKEIAEGKPLSPLLLIRQDNGGPLIIVDGFHRLCAVFAADEQALVPCKIV
ncbi:MAG: hypothetical protein JWP38_2550 [Herbaspirillum sp.]|nr:hypothetical protein [Herbaspirillum sp.]